MALLVGGSGSIHSASSLYFNSGALEGRWPKYGYGTLNSNSTGAIGL